MTVFSQILLMLSAALLVAYPFWGIISPESYALELQEHYAFGSGATNGQIMKSAAMLWISNGVLALSFIFLVLYIRRPGATRWAYLAGLFIALYPVFRTLVEVWSGLNLTSHVENTPIEIEFSSDKAFYFVFGFAIAGMASAFLRDRESVRTRAS
jgi:hypothetical protein